MERSNSDIRYRPTRPTLTQSNRGVRKNSEQSFPPAPVPGSLKEFEPEKPEPEVVYRLSAAHLVFADHDLLQHDFPLLRDESLARTHPELERMELADRATATGRILDEWLMTNSAFISGSQLRQTLVNTPIEASDEQVMAFRPSRYGRALVFSPEVNRRRQVRAQPDLEEDGIEGLLDVKGVGVAPRATPRFATHSNGLMSLGEAIREVIIGKTLNRIFQHSGSCCRAVPSYGVIDPGFDIKWADGMTLPAGMLVRRAHLRPIYRLGMKDSSSPLVDLELTIELLLRRYGITSHGPGISIEIADTGGKTVIKYGASLLQYKEEDIEQIKKTAGFEGGRRRLEGINIQFTREAELNPSRPQIVDFGGFFMKERFENPIVSLVADRLLRLGKIISPCDPDFVQPDEKVRLPGRLWGEGGRIRGYKASRAELTAFVMDKPKILAFNLAREFREKKLTGNDVRNKIEAYVRTSTSRW